ncbi:hypothetical protein KV679_11675 [Bacillus sp. JRC01]|nr:hypothetical protein [Bacillus sp. JRC01]
MPKRLTQVHVSKATRAEEKARLPSIPNEKEDYQITKINPDAHSAVKRRPPDSYGKSGQGETLQACRSGSPQSHVSQAIPAEEKACLPSIPNEKEDYQITKTNPDAHSAVKRRPPDSYGKSGQGETLQACRSGSPHAPWKAGGRSETERTPDLSI